MACSTPKPGPTTERGRKVSAALKGRSRRVTWGAAISAGMTGNPKVKAAASQREKCKQKDESPAETRRRQEIIARVEARIRKWKERMRGIRNRKRLAEIDEQYRRLQRQIVREQELGNLRDDVNRFLNWLGR